VAKWINDYEIYLQRKELRKEKNGKIERKRGTERSENDRKREKKAGKNKEIINFYPFSFLLHSSQKATAAAAATLSESTW